MKVDRWKAVTWSVVFLLAADTSVVMGQGIPVHDNLNWLQLLAQIDKAVIQISILRDQFATSQQHYQMMFYHLQRLANKNTYLAPIRAWQYGSYGNASGTTPSWAQASQGQIKAIDGWLSTIERLPAVLGPHTTPLAKSSQDNHKRDYGHIEIMDGAATHLLQQVGNVRAVEIDRNTAISNLERRALSTDPADNTLNAQLGISNAYAAIKARQEQDSQRMMASFMELQVINAATERNAAASHFQRNAALVTGYADNAARTFSSPSAAVKSYNGFSR